jgi:hypothetical protein
MADMHLGKPSGSLSVPSSSSYVELDKSSWTPPEDGLCHWLVYLNISGSADRVRIKMVREAWQGEGEDASAYHDYVLFGGAALITHTYFEWAEGGRPCHWELDAYGGNITVGTRYTKAALLAPQ